VIPQEKVKELVDAHSKLEDPMTAAIWIRRDAPEAWLVEVIPSLGEDERADEPTYFSPGVEFRFPLALIAGNRSSLTAALRRAPDLARDIAAGQVLFDAGGEADEIIKAARAAIAA
jgi:hypothetical protein